MKTNGARVLGYCKKKYKNICKNAEKRKNIRVKQFEGIRVTHFELPVHTAFLIVQASKKALFCANVNRLVSIS